MLKKTSFFRYYKAIEIISKTTCKALRRVTIKTGKKRFYFFFIVIFLLAILYNLFFAYDQFKHMNAIQSFAARVQARSLDGFIKAFRAAYQEIFIQEHIPLSESSIKLLPVHVTPKISEKFAKLIDNKANIRTVSDNPRNPKNIANRTEMQTIEYFKNNPGADYYEKYIEKNNDQIYFYAAPLRITKRCLMCHGKKENAPLYIRTHYDRAYNYKIGDLRGIVAIYLSQKEIRSYISSIIHRNVYTIFTITLLFLLLFYFLIRKIFKKEQDYLNRLEKEVDEKTRSLTQRSEELQHRLYHDPLTGLPNRKALLSKLSEHNDKNRALILINIDDFNQINDLYGHKAGDLVIEELAQLLQFYCEKNECKLYRMPSDEFALLFLRDVPNELLLKYIDDLVLGVKNYTFDINGSPLHLRIAAGASKDGENLLITADMAIKKAKRERKNYVVYNDDLNMSGKYSENIKWAENLKKALAEDRVVPFFQPIVLLQNKEIAIFEALIRIIDDDGTIHSPFEFLEIAKNTRYYPDLTKRMIDKIFPMLRNFPHHISINLSYLDIIENETMSYVMEKIKFFGIATRLHIEILESEGIERFEDVADCLQKLKSLGCSISIDDFGSGYSNFESILKLNVDMLKIDGSLIRNIDKDTGSRIIVETIVDFANKLDIDTCAEFVCNKEVYNTVNRMGITYAQGFYIGKPQPYKKIKNASENLE